MKLLMRMSRRKKVGRGYMGKDARPSCSFPCLAEGTPLVSGNKVFESALQISGRFAGHNCPGESDVQGLCMSD